MSKSRPRISRIIGGIIGGTALLIAGWGLYSQNMDISLIENSIKKSKSRTITQEIKNEKLNKKILCLVSPDFEISYEKLNENFKSKLRFEYKMYEQRNNLSSKELAKLESIINNFNLDRDSFKTHLGDLNLIDEACNASFIIRENSKDSEVYLHKFKNQKDFFSIFSDEKTRNLDEIIIFAHGQKSFIGCDLPEKFSELPKLLDPNNYITTLDIKMMPENEIKNIRSKLNNNAVIYLLSCEALKKHDKQTTIAEALAYLFQRPVIASTEINYGWFVDAHPYDKIDLSKPETITEENVSYKANYSQGKWWIVYPKTE